VAEVFISYSQKDGALVAPIAARLAEFGIDAWYDREISAGESFSAVIRARLKEAKAVLVCWSPEAIESDWVDAEAEYARGAGVYVPIYIVPCALMPPFNRIHTADLSKWTGEANDPTWIKLVDRIAKLIGRGGVAAATRPAGKAVPAEPFGLTKRAERIVAEDATTRETYEKAADKGNAGAMASLGYFYHNALGVAQDYAKAREWYEKAADKGDAIAMNNLGVLYEHALGVTQDYAKAREWYAKAADKGNAGAMASLGYFYHNALGVAQDYAKAPEWYEKAADKGDAIAMNNLGVLYEHALGVTQDYAKAREWYAKAADNGNADAKAKLQRR
jgi:TIR domain/Sel1 repeat